MATSREYAYYVKGNKVAIVEKGSSIATGTEILNDDGTSTGTYKRSYGELEWKSPHASFDNAIEIEFTHVPQYNINLKAATNPNSSAQTEGSAVFGVFGWTVHEGYLTFIIMGSSGASVDFSAGGYDEEFGTAGTDYILIQNSNTWNGVHKIKARGAQSWIQTETKVYGGGTGYSVGTTLDFDNSAKTIDDDNVLPGIASLFNNDSAGDTFFVKTLTGGLGSANKKLFKVTYDGSYTLTATGHMEISDETSGIWGTGFSYIEDTSTTMTDELNQGATLNKVIQDNCVLLGKNTFSRMVDESFDVDLPNYLCKAIVYYLKAKQLEDMLEIEASEYFMAKFRKQVEKNANSKVSTHRNIQGYGGMR
tara:strand:- start:1530 stop:2621 length:1092 start_codon:yes stop_codon:yes gene_type:complete